MNSETKKLHYASGDKKKSGSKGNKKKSFSSLAPNSSGSSSPSSQFQPSAMVVVRLAIKRTVAGRQETSPRSHSMQRRCISQALQNKSSMMKKETELLLAVNTCYP